MKICLKVDLDKARTPVEEYTYLLDLLNNKIDEKLPWDMHPNELRAADMYRKKLRKKIKAAIDLLHEWEYNS